MSKSILENQAEVEEKCQEKQRVTDMFKTWYTHKTREQYGSMCYLYLWEKTLTNS